MVKTINFVYFIIKETNKIFEFKNNLEQNY